jgi:hypothetical protein
MPLRFKKDFENQTVVLADGTMINVNTIAAEYVQERLKTAPWFSYMLEDTEAPAIAEAPAVIEEPKPRTAKRSRRND